MQTRSMSQKDKEEKMIENMLALIVISDLIKDYLNKRLPSVEKKNKKNNNNYIINV